MARISRRYLNDSSRGGTTIAYTELGREAKRQPVIDLTIGQPDLKPPSALVELLAIEARGAGASRYAPPQGLGEYREAVAELLSEAYGVDAEPDRVVALAGAKPGIGGSIYAACDPGDTVLVLTPHFYTYVIAPRMLGVRVELIPLSWSGGVLTLDEELLKKVFSEKRPCLVIVNTPHNPTGLLLEDSVVKLLGDLARDYNSVILSDEVYAWLVYRGTHTPLVKRLGDDIVVHLESFSKTLAVPGWRVGFAYAPPEMAKAISFFNANTYTCIPRFVQLAIAKYITSYRDDMVEYVEEARRIYSRRAEAMTTALEHLQGLVEGYLPAAGFFLFPRVAGLLEKLGLRDSSSLAELLAREAGVLVVPGTVFGDWREYIRVSLTHPEARLREAVTRIAELAWGSEELRGGTEG